MLILFLKFNEVNELTKNDIYYIELLLDDFGINKNTDFNKMQFEEKLFFINSIQKKLLEQNIKIDRYLKTMKRARRLLEFQT